MGWGGLERGWELLRELAAATFAFCGSAPSNRQDGMGLSNAGMAGQRYSWEIMPGNHVMLWVDGDAADDGADG